MNVRRLDDQRRRTERGRDEQVLIEAERLRDDLAQPVSNEQKRSNSKPR